MLIASQEHNERLRLSLRKGRELQLASRVPESSFTPGRQQFGGVAARRQGLLKADNHMDGAEIV